MHCGWMLGGLSRDYGLILDGLWMDLGCIVDGLCAVLRGFSMDCGWVWHIHIYIYIYIWTLHTCYAKCPEYVWIVDAFQMGYLWIMYGLLTDFDALCMDYGWILRGLSGDY